MDPFTLTAVSMGATALGGLTKTVGNIMGGESQSGMYKYQAGVARINSEIEKQNAAYARTVGERESQRVGMKTRFERGTTLSAQGGRGIDVNTGSAAAVRESQTDLGLHDQDVVRSSAARRAYGHEVAAEKYRTSANMYGKAAQRSKLASYIEAGGTLLGTAASVGGKFMDASKAGIFGGGGDSGMKYGEDMTF